MVVGALCTGMHSPGPIYDPPSDFKPRPSTAGARVPKTRPDRFANGYVPRSASPGPIYQLPSFASQAKPISFGSGPRFPPHSASFGCCYEWVYAMPHVGCAVCPAGLVVGRTITRPVPVAQAV